MKVLQRKLAAVEDKYGESDFERRHYALLGVMCVYGIELLADNIAECRANVLDILVPNICIWMKRTNFYRAASYVLSQNLVHGDALTMRTHDGQPITFAEWGSLGKGKFQRRDFRYESLTQSSSHQVTRTCSLHRTSNTKVSRRQTPNTRSMTVRQLAALVHPK